MLDEAKRYINDDRVEFEGPVWSMDAFWVYVVYCNITVGVILFDEDGKRLPHSTPRSSILNKLNELVLDNN